MNQILSFRQELEKANSCNFQAKITADYGSGLYTFRINCNVDKSGDMKFEVIEPTTISGVSGFFSGEGGKITFDEVVLAFPSVVEGEISPISAPWILYNCLVRGYISSCGLADNGIQVIIDDSFNSENLQCIVWFNDQLRPLYGEIFWKDRRVLSVAVDNFDFS